MTYSIKLSPRTVAILKNFATINPSLQFKVGSVLKTISPSKTIFAHATVEENFESEFAIYDLNKFISVLSLFNEPTLEIEEKRLRIVEDGRAATYTFADPSGLILPPNKELKLPSIDVEFELTQATWFAVKKAKAVLRHEEIAVTGEGGVLSIHAVDTKNPSANKFSVRIGETDKEFEAVFKSSNIAIIDGDYTVQISSKGISRFLAKNATRELDYFIATEKSSKF